MGHFCPAASFPIFDDVVRASQATTEPGFASNALDRILTFVESGNGSVGKLIYDPSCTTA